MENLGEGTFSEGVNQMGIPAKLNACSERKPNGIPG
jgi:hypothetical protein